MKPSLIGSPLLLLTACSDTPKGETGETAPDAPTVEVGDWSPCDLEPGSGDQEAECADAELPWDYGDPTAGTFTAMVKRVPAHAPPSTGQVWVLHGGPGASAVDDLDYLPAGLRELRPDLDVYAVDHRGIGGTAMLACPAQDAGSDEGEVVTEDEWPDCIAALQASWGEHLDHINVTSSAHDVGALIDVLSEPDLPVFVYGGSYGTYLAQRYLQLHPDQASGVVLDGISVPGRGFKGYDAGMNGAGQALFELCAREDACASHFDGDPWQTAEGLIEAFDSGHCPALGTNGDFIRYFLGALLMYDRVRDIVPAVVHRLDRCNDDDVDAIVHLYYAYTGAVGEDAARPAHRPGLTAGNDGEGYSILLFYHVALSEMWYRPGEVDPVQVQAEWEATTMATGLETWLAARLADWPRFPEDAWQGELPSPRVPMLMLQGGLDAATVDEPAREAASHYALDHQTLAWFPTGAHGLLEGSTLPDGTHCGQDLFQQFLADPTRELDLGCIDEVLPVQWDGWSEYNAYFLGTDDAWGDGEVARTDL